MAKHAPTRPPTDPRNIFVLVWWLAVLLAIAGGTLSDRGPRRLGDGLLLAAGVCLAVCGLIVLSDWRDLRARLASWGTEVEVWAIASKPWVARTAGAVLLTGGVLLVVLAARKLA